MVVLTFSGRVKGKLLDLDLLRLPLDFLGNPFLSLRKSSDNLQNAQNPLL